MYRRSFLKTASGALAAAGLAAPSPAAEDAAPIKLGFDTYSLRAFQWKAPQLLDYAAGLKLDTIQISSLGDYESLEPAYLAKVKDQAQRLGIQLDGGTGCICPSSRSFSKNGPPARERVLEGLRVVKAVGGRVMRCYLGGSADRLSDGGIEAHMENTIQVFQSVRSEALDLGVKIAIENHDGDMQARETRTVIEESGKDFVGSNLDTGNPLWVVEDPLRDAGNPGALRDHLAHSRFGAVRASARRGRAMGGAGRWANRLRPLRRAVPPAMPASIHANGGHHRPPAARDSVPGAGFLEGISQGAGFRVRRASWPWPSPVIPTWARWSSKTSPASARQS